MQTLKIKVDKNNLKIINKEILTSGTINVVECEFFFSEEWDNLTKTIIYILDDGRTYIDGIDKETNKCTIPSEVLASKNDFAIGVYGVELVEEKIEERHTTNIEYLSVVEGSYIDNAEEIAEEKEATIWQIYLARMEEIFENIKTCAGETEKIEEISNKAISDIEEAKETSISEIESTATTEIEKYNNNATSQTNSFNSIVEEKKTELNNIKNELNPRIEEIEKVIPAQATEENQLADKDFVNSSISTSTATFRGTYNSLEELQEVESDINDYGNVIELDELGNQFYNRYTYDGTDWIFNFKINTTTFTSEQWKAINSNATAELIEQIKTNKIDITNIQESKADKAEIPTKISQLNNDNNYISKDYADELNSNINVSIDELKKENELLKDDYTQGQAEGESIHIEDSGELPMLIHPKGNTPMQDTRVGYNQLEYSLEQLQQINTKGIWNGNTYTINGLDITINDNMSLKLNGTNTADIEFNLINNGLNSIKSGTYTIYLDGREKLKSGIYFNTENSVRITDIGSSAENSVISKSFNIDNDTIVSRIWIFMPNNSNFNNKILYPMIYEGTEEKTYEQYGVMPSTEFHSKVKIVEENYEIVNRNQNIAEEIIVNGSKNIYAPALYVKADLKPNTNYIISFIGNLENQYYTNENLFKYQKNIICNGNRQSINVTTKETIDINNTNVYFQGKYIIFKNLMSQGLDNKFYELQIEEGSILTDYVEHREQILPLDIPESIRLYGKEDGFLELSQEQAEKLGLEGEGIYAYNTRGKYVVTGNESASDLIVESSGRFLVKNNLLNNIIKNNSNDNVVGAYCNQFSELTANQTWGKNEGFSIDIAGNLNFYSKKYARDLESFKNYLQNNNIEIIAPLETPIYTKITDEIFISQWKKLKKAFSYYPVTNITANATDELEKAPLIISVEYLKSQKFINENLKSINENLKSKKNYCRHFFFEGKEPYWDTVNQTITIYANCPVIVGNKTYISSNDCTINLELINNSPYIALLLDTTNSTYGKLSFILKQASTMNDDNTENLALFAVFNLNKKICESLFNINIDGNLRYADGSKVEELQNSYNNISSAISDKIELFDINDSIDGEYYNNVGDLIKAEGVSRTPLIYIKNLKKIYVYLPNASKSYNIGFFDKNKSFLSNIIYSLGGGEFNFEVPENAVYISTAFYTDDKSNFYLKGSYDIFKNEYQNKKMNCLGDSITYGYVPDSGAQMNKPFPKILKEKLGLVECRNYGISGSTLTDKSNPMSVRYANMDDDADIVSVFGGTNDYGRGAGPAELGTMGDVENTTIYGALDILCNGLIEKYPKAFIFFITPLRRSDKTGTNSAGFTLEDVAKAIKEVCYKYSIPVLDLYASGGFHTENEKFRTLYSGNDRLHPNQDYVEEHLEPIIEKFIRSNY